MNPLPILASFHSVLHFFIQGGFFMFLLLLCSVVSVTVIILRTVALRRRTVMPPFIENTIEELQPTGDRESIVRLSKLVQGDPSPLGRIAQVGLRHLQWPRSENIEAVQTRARHEIVRMESGLVVLEVIVGIAPLLGLLGAVSGLVTVFANLGSSATVTDPRGIAKGISEALSTTVVGMAVAIPTLIAYSYFSKKIEEMAAEMESLIADMLAKCYYHKQKRSDAASATGPSAEDIEDLI
jgi:biopolymer transport protein ExbB